MGAYMRTNGAVGARNVAQFMSGPYRIAEHRYRCFACWLTNKTPVGTYRGPGRFETDFFRERLFDMVAKDLGVDRVEFRRRNLVPHRAMPYPIATITPYESKDELDSGDYHVTLERCLDEIEWGESTKLQGRVVDGRYHGFAVGCFIEGRRRRAEGNRAARARAGRTLFGVCRLFRRSGRAGDRICADRGRCAGSADGAHSRCLSRLARPM